MNSLETINESIGYDLTSFEKLLLYKYFIIHAKKKEEWKGFGRNCLLIHSLWKWSLTPIDNASNTDSKTQYDEKNTSMFQKSMGTNLSFGSKGMLGEKIHCRNLMAAKWIFKQYALKVQVQFILHQLHHN